MCASDRTMKTPTDLPSGMIYRPDVVAPGEEAALLSRIEELPFHEVRMKGVVARRTVIHYGWDYGYDSWRVEPAAPIPIFLLHVREVCGFAAGIPPEEFVQVLVSRYPPSAGIGWHRDAPMFGPVVAGVSLGAACRLRLRRAVADGHETRAIELAPRSLYILGGEARSTWQHSIPGVKTLRYSITFRQLRRGWLEKHGRAAPVP
jgi:alkylated DNA repair dioxygenase AlkB